MLCGLDVAGIVGFCVLVVRFTVVASAKRQNVIIDKTFGLHDLCLL